MRRGNYIRPGMVNARMDRERGSVHRVLAFDNFPALVHQNQVRDADVTEMHTEGIDPEMFRSFRIARGNVPGHTFVKTELGKKTEGRGQALFAVSSFLFHGCERRNGGDFEDTRGCGAHRTPRAKTSLIITPRRLAGLQEQSFILVSVMDPFLAAEDLSCGGNDLADSPHDQIRVVTVDSVSAIVMQPTDSKSTDCIYMSYSSSFCNFLDLTLPVRSVKPAVEANQHGAIPFEIDPLVFNVPSYDL